MSTRPELGGELPVFRPFASGDPASHGGLPVLVVPAGGAARTVPSGALVAVVAVQDDVRVNVTLEPPAAGSGVTDGAVLAALTSLRGSGLTADLCSVHVNGEPRLAQWCSGEWLLHQGTVRAHPLPGTADPTWNGEAWLATLEAGQEGQEFPEGPSHLTLVQRVPDEATLLAFQPGAETAMPEVPGNVTGRTVFCRGGARRTDVTFRHFDRQGAPFPAAVQGWPLAALAGVLSQAGLLDDVDDGAQLIRGVQVTSDGLARLTAQFTPTGDGAQGVWVGGPVAREDR